MNENLMMIFEMVPIFVILTVLEILMPKLTRKGIAFGVKIPEEKADSQEIKNIYAIYVKENIAVSIPYILVLAVLTYFTNVYSLVIGLFLFIGIEFVIYMEANKKVKTLKKSMDWNKGKKQVVAVDMNFSKEKGKKAVASPLWFLIPVVLIILNVIIGFAVYKNIPNTVAIHFDAAGKANGWAHKSYGLILLMPAIMTCLTGVMFYSYKIIGWSKQQISSENPEESIEKNRRFRLIWSRVLVLMTALLVLLFTSLNLSILAVIKLNVVYIHIITLVIVITVVIASIYTGQGGSRIKVTDKEPEAKKVIDRDDDNNWKIANSIYFNTNDPALFVEKRFGIGWTINFGNKKAIVVFALLILFIVAMAVIPELLLK